MKNWADSTQNNFITKIIFMQYALNNINFQCWIIKQNNWVAWVASVDSSPRGHWGWAGENAAMKRMSTCIFSVSEEQSTSLQWEIRVFNENSSTYELKLDPSILFYQCRSHISSSEELLSATCPKKTNLEKDMRTFQRAREILWAEK